MENTRVRIDCPVDLNCILLQKIVDRIESTVPILTTNPDDPIQVKRRGQGTEISFNATAQKATICINGQPAQVTLYIKNE